MFWYEEEIRQIERRNRQLDATPRVVFYGSSSIRLWGSLEEDFAGIPVHNLGFGGSTLAACVWFFERVFAHCTPRSMIFYAGDNDLGDNRHPEEVYIFYQQLVARFKALFPEVPFVFVSIKPSLCRWHIIDRIKFTNELIKKHIETEQNAYYADIFSRMLRENGQPDARYFEPDGLHISTDGYRLWKELLLTEFASLF